MTGTVLSGTQPIVGATVAVWSTGTSQVQVGSSVTTDASGAFSINFTCPSSTALMIVTASGGHIGSAAANAHIQLVSALGACGSLPASVVVNELTSTAAVYALSGFAPTAGTAAVTFQGKSPNINQAFLTLSNLIVPATGTFAASSRVTDLTVVQQRLDTLANAMAACDASTTGAACTELFSCAAANATFAATGQPCTGGTSTITTDVLNAALSVVQNAGLVSMAGVYDVATQSTAFSPALSAAPLEWSLPLVFTVPNYGPVVADAGGHIWMLAPDPNPAVGPPAIPNLAVTEIDADGTFLSPHKTGHDWSGGGVSSIPGNDTTNIAIDQSGNVWVSGTGPTVAELNSSGAGVTGAPWNAGNGPDDTAAVTIDSSGNAWLASGNTAPSVFEISGGTGATLGTNLSGSSGYSTLNCPCNGMAADAMGDVWLISSGTNQFLSQLNPQGVEGVIQGPPAVNGMSGLSQFWSVAADGGGNLWITDKHYHGVWEFTPSGAAGTYSPAPFSNAAGAGTTPKAIVIDGANHKWIANDPTSNFPSITELSADGTMNLSPSDGFGFQVTAVTKAYGLAVDGSGNVWVTDGGSGSGGTVTEYVGAAAPTKNPISSAIKAGSFVP
jgi:hypothetical protein